MLNVLAGASRGNPMNDETVLPTEILVDQPSEPAPQETEATVAPTDDWSLTDETVSVTIEPDYVAVMESVGSDIAHVNLFGSFLICGTLIGIFILRRIHGT